MRFRGPEVGVLERRDHFHGRIDTECIRIADLQNDLRLGFAVLWDLGDERIGTLAVAQLARVVIGRELQIEAGNLAI
jgi:hypothetical protein